MQHLSAFFERVIGFIQPWAEQLGAPGLAIIAFLDSSFLSLPQVGDALLVGLTLSQPSNWVYYATATTLGSMAGCFALFSVGRKGGEAFLRRKFKERHIDRGLAVFQKHGWLAVTVPSLLPPPTPFKLFVLLAGVADLRPLTFILAVGVGRGFRYGGEAWLAYMYGDRATEFIRHNLPIVSMWLGIAILVLGAAAVIWRRRQA